MDDIEELMRAIRDTRTALDASLPGSEGDATAPKGLLHSPVAGGRANEARRSSNGNASSNHDLGSDQNTLAGYGDSGVNTDDHVHRHAFDTSLASPGRADNSPGAANDSPGRADNSPGAANIRPGRADNSPGAANIRPRQADNSPGAANIRPRQADNSPGAANDSPGRADNSPGAADNKPGHTDNSPGRANRPGHTDNSSGWANTSPGRANTSPGRGNISPGRADLSPLRAREENDRLVLDPDLGAEDVQKTHAQTRAEYKRELQAT
jgi:hypothetical protein